MLRRSLALLLLVPYLVLPAAQARQLAQPESLAITHVTVIDVAARDARRALIPDQTVIVTGNRITALGKAGRVKVPAGSQVVDAMGKFLIPGLWDMHVHSMYEGRPEFFFPLFIANGVTGVRELASAFPLEHINRLRREILEGKTLGPRFGAVAGKIIEGQNQPAPRLPEFDYVATAEEGRRLVRERKAQGADFVKVYSSLPRDVYFAIADEAKEQGLPLAGHIPLFLNPSEISEAKQKSVEHLADILMPYLSGREAELRKGLADRSINVLEARRIALDTYDAEKAAALFERFRKNGTWQCPTFVIKRTLAFAGDPLITGDARLKLHSPLREGAVEEGARPGGASGSGRQKKVLRERA
jgi:hypothetical protein